MPDFDEPAMRRIVQAHFLFLKPRRRIVRVHHNMLIVVWQGWIVDPCVGLRDRVKWISCAIGQGRIVGIDLANPENACRRAFVAFGLLGSGLVRAKNTASPGEATLAVEHAKRGRGWTPRPALALEELEFARGRVPACSNGYRQLSN